MALMHITVIPIGTGSTSVGNYIADIEHFLREKGIEHSLHDMGTIIAGSTKELLEIAAEIHNLPLTKGAERVVTSLTLDERLDKERKIGDKQRAVLQRIQQSDQS